MSDTTSTQHKLNQQRQLAVQLRLDGLTLADITRQSGLSAPTIIAAHKAYLSGGWGAIKIKPRGRPTGDRLLSQEQQDILRELLLISRPEETDAKTHLWSYSLTNEWLKQQGHLMTNRSASTYMKRWDLYSSHPLELLKTSTSEETLDWIANEYQSITSQSLRDGTKVYWVGVSPKNGYMLFHAYNSRKKFFWMTSPNTDKTADTCIDFFNRLLREADSGVVIILNGIDITRISSIQQWLREHSENCMLIEPPGNKAFNSNFNHQTTPIREKIMATPENIMLNEKTTQKSSAQPETLKTSVTLTHLQRLEAESIHIMREVVAEADNPVMLYSAGKDSAVMLHLALKAFYPAKPPFPLLHVDTRWKFREMYEYRDKMVEELGLELLTHINPDGIAQKVNPFTHGSGLHTDIMKTEGLKQALNKHQFDVAFGGARRDEERSRAKERIFSFRSSQHRWEPKNQRPELWHLYNARKKKDESIRVFPLSNWTELDIWQYIHLENISIAPLYYAAERPVVERNGMLIMVDDDRMPLQPGEVPIMRKVRFRTLGCYPLTGAVESNAHTLPEIIQEMLLAPTSEREGRMIDHDSAASMEKKKQEGYF
ncbi:MAG: sulfate adenylyltransferase subunit 2 [Gammaproteobacteria bacterium]|jgi:sulfate adenylyltransferase subunit 2